MAVRGRGGLQESVGKNQRCEDNSCSAARYSPPSSNLLREMVKGTEQSCYAQAEVLGTDRPCRGQGVSTSSRRKSEQCENFDNGPIFYIIIIAPSGDSFNNARRVKLPCGTAGSAMVSPGPSTSGGGESEPCQLLERGLRRRGRRLLAGW